MKLSKRKNYTNKSKESVCVRLGVMILASAVAAPSWAQQNAGEEEAVEEIVVTGIRRSLQQALGMKRNAESVVDAIVAEDIGKFPDQNLAESLQRVSGVSIDRQRGEGSRVSIRGLGPEFVRVEVNGRTGLSGAGAGAAGGIGGLTNDRTFYFDSMQSELVGAVEVYKSAQANLLEGGLGGTVKIRTRRPFDNGGERILTGSAMGTYSELTDDTGSRFAGVFSDTFADETLGFLIGVAYDDRTVREDWFQLMDYEPKIFNNAIDENGISLDGTCTLLDTTQGCGYFAGNVRMGIVNDNRERLNVTSAIQWRPSDTVEVTIDLFKNEYTSDYLDLQLPLRTQAGLAAGAGEVYLNENDIVTYLTTNKARPRPFPYDFNTTRDQDQIAGNLTFTPNDRIEISLDASWTEATTDELETKTFYDIPGGVPVTYDARNSFVPSVVVDANLTDPSLYNFSWFKESERSSVDEERQLRGDFTYHFDDGTSISAGISYRDRDRDYGVTIYNIGTRFGNFLNEPLTNTVYHELPYSDAFSGIGGGANTWPSNWLWADPAAVRQQYFVDRRDELPADQFDSADALSGEEFLINEKTLGAYLMLDIGGYLGDIPYSGNIGARVVRVKRDSTGNVQPINAVVYNEASGVYAFELGPAEPQSFDSKNTEVLPALNLKFDLSEDLIARFAWGKTMTQPGFSQLNPGGTKEASQRVVNEGNPFLDPYVAQQLDLTLEWYPTESSIVALAAFGKEVDSFITTTTLVEDWIDPVTNEPIPDLESGGNVRLQYNNPRNEEGAVIGGIEFAFQHAFTNLPAPWNGLGAQLNYTWVSTNADFINPNSGASFDVPGLSENTVNAVVFYENDRWSGRLAWNWRDKFLSMVSDTRSNPRFTKSYAQLDASLSVNLNERTSLVFEGINLTDNNVEQYNIVGPVSNLEQLRAISNTGPRIQVGVRIGL
jgi:iron complex outermembrane receptor protein